MEARKVFVFEFFIWFVFVLICICFCFDLYLTVTSVGCRRGWKVDAGDASTQSGLTRHQRNIQLRFKKKFQRCFHSWKRNIGGWLCFFVEDLSWDCFEGGRLLQCV